MRIAQVALIMIAISSSLRLLGSLMPQASEPKCMTEEEQGYSPYRSSDGPDAVMSVQHTIQ